MSKRRHSMAPKGALGQPQVVERQPLGLTAGGSGLLLAQQRPAHDKRFVQSAKAWFLDPFIYANWRGNQGKPGITWDALRQMADTCEPIVAIHRTRQNQVSAFSHKASDDTRPGWRVALKDVEKQPDEADKKRIAEVEYFFEHMHAQVPDRVHQGLRCGPGLDYPELNFDGFLRKIVRDRLTLDALVLWKNRSRDRSLLSVHPTDPGTIVRVFPPESMGGWNEPGLTGAARWLFDAERRAKGEVEEIRYVQRVNGQEVAYFTEKEMTYRYANPRSDIRYAGYGQSELEQMIMTVSGILFGMRYNMNAFTNNSIPEGLLVLFGMYDAEQLEGFKREFEAHAAGLDNSHRLPIITAMAGAEGQGRAAAEWIRMRDSNKEMQYSEWMQFLVNIACAVYQISPEEINFKGFGGPDNVMSERGPDTELRHSKDKGLRPLLEWIAHLLTDDIIAEFYEDLCFEFVNFDVQDESTKLKNTQLRLQAALTTVNEERAKMDLDKVEEDWADAPGNPVLMQVYMQQKQAEMQEQQMGQQQAMAGQEQEEDQGFAKEDGWKRFLYEQSGGEDAGTRGRGDAGKMTGGGEDGKAGGSEEKPGQNEPKLGENEPKPGKRETFGAKREPAGPGEEPRKKPAGPPVRKSHGRVDDEVLAASGYFRGWEE